MLKTISVFSAVVLLFANAGAQAQTVNGTVQEVPATPTPMALPQLQQPQGNVSIIQLQPGAATGGTTSALPAPPSVTNFAMTPSQPFTWSKPSGGGNLATTNPDDKYEGRWICAAYSEPYYLVGFILTGNGQTNCVFARGNQVGMSQQYAVLKFTDPRNNGLVPWMSQQDNRQSQGIILSSLERGRGFPVCRALVNNALQAGWADGNGCHVVYQEQKNSGQNYATATTAYDFIPFGRITEKPASSQPGTAANPGHTNLGSLFDVDANHMTPNKGH